MRYSRLQESAAQQPEKRQPESHAKPSSKKMIFFIVLLIAAVAVYLIGAAAIGDFFSKNIITPVISFFTGEEPQSSAAPQASGTPAPQASAAPVAKVEIPAMPVYALQVGVFDNLENARQLAQALQEKGGAGYIEDNGNSFRVLIAAYAKESDAKNVKQRLAAEESMDSKIYVIGEASANVSLDASVQQTAALEEAIAFSGQMVADMLALSISYDKGEVPLEEAMAKIASLSKKANSLETALDESGVSKDNILVKNLLSFLGEATSIVNSISGDTGSVAYSATLKHAYMAIAELRAAMVAGV